MVSWRRPIHFLGHDRSNETWSRVDEYLNLSTRLLDKIYVSRMSDEVTSLWSLTAINIKSYTHSNYKFSNETYGDQPNAKETIKTPQNSHRWPVYSTQKGHWCCDAKCFWCHVVILVKLCVVCDIMVLHHRRLRSVNTWYLMVMSSVVLKTDPQLSRHGELRCGFCDLEPLSLKNIT